MTGYDPLPLQSGRGDDPPLFKPHTHLRAIPRPGVRLKKAGPSEQIRVERAAGADHWGEPVAKRPPPRPSRLSVLELRDGFGCASMPGRCGLERKTEGPTKSFSGNSSRCFTCVYEI